MIESEQLAETNCSFLWKGAGLVILRFFFDYMRSRFQESISYELEAKDRLAPRIDELKEGLPQYYEIEQTTDIG